MSRTTIKVEIPSFSPDELIKLGNKVEAYHNGLAAESPLNRIDMGGFSLKLKSAYDLRVQAKKLHEQAESLNQQANLELGIDKTQNSKTPGTIFSTLTSVRDVLLGINRGKEEKLSEWGFKVVTGTVVNKMRGGVVNGK